MQTVNCEGQIYTPSKVVCIGKNYPDHIKEMGGDGLPNEPAIFIKPNSAIAYCPNKIVIPKGLGLVHYEVELCFLVGCRAKDITPAGTNDCIRGFAVGIDLTLRDRQSVAKKAGGPWALAKGFDNSAVLGRFVAAEGIGDPCALDIELRLNGTVRQKSNTSEMIFSPARILSFVSGFMTIEEGDVFMCGTPKGVGEVTDGAKVLATIQGMPRLEFSVDR